jgi:chromosome segregation ATPase
MMLLQLKGGCAYAAHVYRMLEESVIPDLRHKFSVVRSKLDDDKEEWRCKLDAFRATYDNMLEKWKKQPEFLLKWKAAQAAEGERERKKEEIERMRAQLVEVRAEDEERQRTVAKFEEWKRLLEDKMTEGKRLTAARETANADLEMLSSDLKVTMETKRQIRREEAEKKKRAEEEEEEARGGIHQTQAKF